MEISISAVTANRVYSKALSRILSSGLQKYLREVANDINMEPEIHTVLQVVFCDSGYNSPKRTCRRINKVFQVSVNWPEGLTYKTESDFDLQQSIINKIILAIELAPLNDIAKNEVINRLRKKISENQ